MNVLRKKPISQEASSFKLQKFLGIFSCDKNSNLYTYHPKSQDLATKPKEITRIKEETVTEVSHANSLGFIILFFVSGGGLPIYDEDMWQAIMEKLYCIKFYWQVEIPFEFVHGPSL